MDTIKVKHSDSEGNDHLIINLADFNKDQHEPFDDFEAKKLDPKRSPEFQAFLDSEEAKRIANANRGVTTGTTVNNDGRNPSGTFSEPTPTDIRFPNKDLTEFENNRGAFRRKSASDLRKEKGLPDVPGGVLGFVIIPDAWRRLNTKDMRALAEEISSKKDLTIGESKSIIAEEIKRREKAGIDPTTSDEELEALKEAQAKAKAAGATDEVDDGLDAMTVSGLKEYADKNDIDIGDASKKADIIEAIRAAQTE